MRHFLAAALLFACTARANGQFSQDDTWGELGLGYGSAHFSCDSCAYRRITGSTSPRLEGWDMSLGLGCKFNQHLQLGAAFYIWLNGLKKNDSLPELDMGTVLLSYFPRRRGGPVFEIGTGVSYYSLELGTGDPIEPSSKTTPAYVAGWGTGSSVGFGWQVLGVTPRVTFAQGREPKLHASGGGTAAHQWKHNLLLIEVTGRTH